MAGEVNEMRALANLFAGPHDSPVDAISQSDSHGWIDPGLFGRGIAPFFFRTPWRISGGGNVVFV
jgi:hypothetical protein